MKQAGVLMPVSALPSEHGIGDFGKTSYQFVDYLEQMKMKVWQILPINPLGYGNSPYQAYSSFAGEELYISLAELQEMNLITSKIMTMEATTIVDYEAVRNFKKPYLQEAFANFEKNYQEYEDEFSKFLMENKWVEDYALFICFKIENDMKPWTEWQQWQKDYPLTRDGDLSEYEDKLKYHMFIQFIFQKQWLAIKEYANKKQIKVMGDIPIYVAEDSQDVWTNRKVFDLDENGKPIHIAGVPPDYFSKTGQRWGNPLYDWEYLESTNFDFWINRISINTKMFDIIRIDHFRAFDTYWQIKATEETAINGQWLEAPGYALFDEIYSKLPNIELVAEDLGDLRPQVHELRDHYNLMGMKIIQFTFDPNETNNDFEDRENMVAYTGTHDNQTILGWYEAQDQEAKEATKTELAKHYQGKIHEMFIEYSMDSIANLVIIPTQDIIGLDDVARFNTPGTVGSPNWEWKLADYTEFVKSIDYMKTVVVNYKRGK